jgi:hypothetical protein
MDSIDLAACRVTQELMMGDTCTVRSRSLTAVGDGTYTESYTEVTKKSRVAVLGAREQVIAAQLGIVAQWVVALPYGTVIAGKDQLVWKGRTLHVTGVLDDSTWGMSVRVFASERL